MYLLLSIQLLVPNIVNLSIWMVVAIICTIVVLPYVFKEKMDLLRQF